VGDVAAGLVELVPGEIRRTDLDERVGRIARVLARRHDRVVRRVHGRRPPLAGAPPHAGVRRVVADVVQPEDLLARRGDERAAHEGRLREGDEGPDPPAVARHRP
jgi:hypothetical protein